MRVEGTESESLGDTFCKDLSVPDHLEDATPPQFFSAEKDLQAARLTEPTQCYSAGSLGHLRVLFGPGSGIFNEPICRDDNV